MSSTFRLVRLNPDGQRPLFDCGDNDLNEFFHTDSVIACNELMAVTYALYQDDVVAAFYCVSNDAIRQDLTSGNRFKTILRRIATREKRYRSVPSVKIGRFAVSEKIGRNGIGSQLMDAIKYDFTHGNKTGCRYIIVDAYNKPEVINFYLKNGFEYLQLDDDKELTRLMFYDLIQFVRAGE